MEKKKILVVDDEPDFVELMQVRLETNGYSVLTAHNAAEAMKKVKENPDAILLDIMMPDVDGYTLFRRLRKDCDTRSIPIIVVTAKPEMKELFQMEGVDKYLVKPVDNEELLSAIKNATGEIE